MLSRRLKKEMFWFSVKTSTSNNYIFILQFLNLFSLKFILLTGYFCLSYRGQGILVSANEEDLMQEQSHQQLNFPWALLTYILIGTRNYHLKFYYSEYSLKGANQIIYITRRMDSNPHRLTKSSLTQPLLVCSVQKDR